MDYDLTSTYDYELPPELIADVPTPQRTASRLMVGTSPNIEHRRFADLPDLLREGDLLVFNDTRVVSARLHGRKPTGGAVELFVIDVLHPCGSDRWSCEAETLTLRCMTRASKPVRVGQILTVSEVKLEVLAADAGIADVRVTAHTSADALLARLGDVPLPPYIVRRRAQMGAPEVQAMDQARYQTVYASRPGAVAAPTAGLHFDESLLQTLDAKGVRRATITLEVGPGTFRPVTSERLSEHEMHTERYIIDDALAESIERTRRDGGRVVAVGTTTVRTLESEAKRLTPFEPGERTTALFIAPGFEFAVVDAMITNFHLPRSTLLALVYAFGGPEQLRRMYETAVAERYRFYSYGDAMLLWRNS